MMKNDNPTVYSTEWGRICPNCGQPVEKCTCRKKTAAPKGDGVVRVSRESKGRGGKTVTVISGVLLNEDELRKLAGELKRICGVGGTIKDGVIEIQGEQRDKVIETLKKKGFTVKKAGG